MTPFSRRQFLQQASALTATVSLLSPRIARAFAQSPVAASETLDASWEYLRMPLANPVEVWMSPPLAPWTAVTLPHCVNAMDGCDPDVPAYRGKAWYRRTLKPANPFPNGRTLLHFEGAGQTTEVYIGRRQAGRNIGGYNEFVVDITEHLADATKPAGVQLSVLTDNSPDLDRLPSDLSDFTLYGGLYRPVHLVYVPAVSLESVHIHVKAATEAAQVRVSARLYNPSHATGAARITVVVTDPGGVEAHRLAKDLATWTGQDELTSFTLPRPQLWSPKQPQLYQCSVTLQTAAGESIHVERFGIRFFEFMEHGPFLLNGERLLIQGTHRHEDHAGYAAAMPAELIRREMVLIRDMGANFIRLAHYQQQRLVLDLCDEIGLLVWEELPWCRAGVSGTTWQQQGKEKLALMIDQHFNHPSIILWGLGNEDDWEGEYPSVDKESIRDYMQQLHVLAHQLDDTRLTSFRRCDFARDIPDVYSPSIWAGWYGGRYVDYESTLNAQRARVQRLLHVEWGADSHAGRHSEDPYKGLTAVQKSDTAERGMAYLLEGGAPRVSRDGDWSETYACDLMDWHLKVQQSLPWLSGAVQWIFKDFTTPLRSENPIPRINEKGLVGRDLTLKESYFVFQSYWSEKPMAHIYGHTWPVRWGKSGELRVVKVYSNCTTAELFLNGQSVGVRHRDIQNFPAAGLHWNVAFAQGENHLRVVATAANAVAVQDEIKLRYETEPWAAPAALTLAVSQRSTDTITLEAMLLDASGKCCLDARNRVRFSVAGAGRMLDNLGTVGGSRVIELCNGRASISIRQTKGASIVAVETDGIAQAFCKI